ncbi:hypothetical protein J0X15_10880 [Roseibium sp. CAU 1637]|uniref:Uncharacterized protein n=1 Tax=Roseibium limicola TaxID=2816037 RepID=A0A939EQL0_9HYPH|nr:hypothetical protein [Roseibium limicola]MBO0345723.1 hypothetical protein [Roseibium limicola]
MKGWEVSLGFEPTAVADLRHKDTVFDEICSDYEEMLDARARSATAAGAEDLADTIAALELEMSNYLQT